MYFIFDIIPTALANLCSIDFMYLDSLRIAIGLLFKCKVGSTVQGFSCLGGIINTEDLDGFIVR